MILLNIKCISQDLIKAYRETYRIEDYLYMDSYSIIVLGSNQ